MIHNSDYYRKAFRKVVIREEAGQPWKCPDKLKGVFGRFMENGRQIKSLTDQIMKCNMLLQRERTFPDLHGGLRKKRTL